jgi:hypothetical protein
MIRAERQRIKSVHIEERGETSSVEAEDLSRSSGSPQTLDHLLIEGLAAVPAPSQMGVRRHCRNRRHFLMQAAFDV